MRRVRAMPLGTYATTVVCPFSLSSAPRLLRSHYHFDAARDCIICSGPSRTRPLRKPIEWGTSLSFSTIWICEFTCIQGSFAPTPLSDRPAAGFRSSFAARSASIRTRPPSLIPSRVFSTRLPSSDSTTSPSSASMWRICTRFGHSRFIFGRSGPPRTVHISESLGPQHNVVGE